MKSNGDGLPGSAKLTRRAVLGLLSVSAGVALASACQSVTAPVAPAPTAAPAASPATATPVASAAAQAATTATQPRSGGSLRVGVLGDLSGLDGHLTTGLLDTLYRVYDTVITQDDKLNMQPALAETVELSSDARQLKLGIRKGVQFHTGRE